jgi:two-component system, OmpR family, sensor histidine kinase BaeS
MMRGRPLALRLAALLAGVVVVVLLVAGLVVNRAASRSLEETLGPREQQRIGLALAIIEDGLERGSAGRGGGRPMERLLGRVAAETRGQVRVLDADGEVVARAGHVPDGGEVDTIRTELSAAAGGGTLELDVPSARAPFLRAFNTALLVTGAAAVAALLVAGAVLAARVTRPLQGVAAAARRLGDGDLTARARGGPDAESAELASAFNGMADRLERSEALRRRAASDLAHDLATPATVLESQLQAMVDGVVPADAAELEKARASAAALSGVILQLGELTQAEAAGLGGERRLVDLAALVGEVAAGLDGLRREAGVEIEIEIDGDGPSVHADAGHLERAVRNVLTNAIQHAPPGSVVSVAMTAEDDRAVVRITDRGPGIAAEDVPYIFERFYRADRSRTGGGRRGSGVGLTVTRELLEANGGGVDVERTGPDGTTFRVWLPLP